jgi:hypothetical protein
MLVQQFRYDMSWQRDPVGGTTSNYGVSRGVEIIPATRFEVGIFPPNYLVHQRNIPDGFGDFSFQLKFRAFSAPEGHGDYFVGIFLGGSFPTGTPPNGLGHTVLSPTLGGGKGIGPWDIQSTIGGNLPVSGANLGRAIIFNTAVDYRIKGRIWPMIEQNTTFWSGGALDGRKQVFLTPGLVVGSFPVAGRLRFAIGKTSDDYAVRPQRRFTGRGQGRRSNSQRAHKFGDVDQALNSLTSNHITEIRRCGARTNLNINHAVRDPALDRVGFPRTSSGAGGGWVCYCIYSSNNSSPIA